MTETTAQSTSEHSFLDLIILFIDSRKIIFWSVGISILLGIFFASISTRQYKSIASVLPPKESNAFAGLSGISSLVKSLPSGLAKLGKAEEDYDYIAILRSRTVMEEIVGKFHLVQVYEISDSSMEKAAKVLKDNTEIDWTEENILEIRVWDTDAIRAALIANYCVEVLNRRIYELQTQQARNMRIFIEQRLKQNQADLQMAEQALRAYQEKTGFALLTDVSNPRISSIAELYGAKVKKEIEVSVLKQTLGDASQQYRQGLLELETLKSKLASFPSIGLESYRLLREIAIQQKIMEFVVPLYEQAKVDEHKDVPVAYVLDTAVPGERPDRPKRTLIFGIFVFLGLVAGSVVIFLSVYVREIRVNSPEQWRRIQGIRHSLTPARKFSRE